METALSIILLLLCLNVGIYFISEQLGLEQFKNKQIFNKTELENYEHSLDQLRANSTQQSAFDLNLIFGDFIKGVNMLIDILSAGADIFSLGPVIRMFQLFSFPDTFVLPAKIIVAFLFSVAILFMVTGRGSKSSI